MTSEESLHFKVAAPGKVILFGEHSVVYGKTALAGSVNLKTKLSFSVASFASAENISLHLPSIGLHTDLKLKKLRKILSDTPIPLHKNTSIGSFSLDTPEKIVFSELLAKVQEFIKKTVTVPLTPLKENALSSFLCVLLGMFSSVNVHLASSFIEVTSQIPIGAGMGSSTAYNVCLAAAFLNYIRICVEKAIKDETSISRKDYKPFKYWNFDATKFDSSELDLISRWALIGDKVMHGNPSGIDNVVCTFGRVVEFRKGERSNTIKMIPNPRHLNLLLVNTKVPRNTKVLVDFVASRRDRFCTVVDPILDSMDSLAVTAAGVLRRMGELTCVCDNGETELVETISDEIEKLEELADINQKLLESLGVSHDSLEFICQISREIGLHAKLTGAGGGGFAFVIIPHKGKNFEVEEMITTFQDKGFSVYKVILGGSGVCIMKPYEELMFEKDDKEESQQGSLTSKPSLKGFYPDLSCAQEIHSPIQIPETIIKKPWPGPVNYRDLVSKMLDAQEQLKEEKSKMPIDPVIPEKENKEFKEWKKKFLAVWKPVIDEFEKRDVSPKHEGVYRIGDDTIPIQEMLWDNKSFIPERICAGRIISPKRRTSKKGGEQSIAKGEEARPSGPWPVWKASVGQTKFPFAHGSAKWLNEQFPVEYDMKEAALCSVPNRTMPQVQLEKTPEKPVRKGFGFCEKAGPSVSEDNQKDHFFLQNKLSY